MKRAKRSVSIFLVLLTLAAWAAVFSAAQSDTEPSDGTAVEAALDTAPSDAEETTAAPKTAKPSESKPDKSKKQKASVELTASSVEVTVRKTIQMTAEPKGFDGTPEVVWNSSDESVAAVDQTGKVTGVKAGRATITATATCGETTASGNMVIFVEKSKTPAKLLLQKFQVLGYKYSFKDDYYYVNDVKCWQQGFGFGRFYDLVAPYILLEYDYVRVFFTYENKDYMIQLWKGQYGLIFYGCEQGIYYKAHSDKEDGIFTFYKAMDQSEWPQMKMTLYHDKQRDGNFTREFTRDFSTHWWCSGFKPGHLKVEEPANELRQEGTIVFKSAEMAKYFADGLKICGFGEAKDEKSIGLDEYYLNGSTVSFLWQEINDAETTMPIKIAGGTAFAAGTLAFFVGLLVLLAIFAMMGMGIVFLIILL